MGVDLGFPRALSTEPALDNEKGHWEHKEIALINETIFSRYGGSWHKPPILPAGWESSPALDDLRNAARKLIQEQFADTPLWGWKDPRTCLTLQFWQQLVSNVHYILCLRNPVDVARSLAKRDGFSSEKSFQLWFAHVSAALKSTEGKPCLTVFYEDMIDNPAEELSRIAQFLDKSELVGNTHVQAFFDKRLQHYSSPSLDPTFNSTSESYAKTLYLAQLICANRHAKQRIEQVSQALQTLHCQSQQLTDEMEPSWLSKQLLESNEIVRRLSSQLDGQARALEAEAEAAAASVRSLAEQLHERELELERIKETFGFRLLSRCWHIKHKYFLPLFRRAG